MGKAMPFIPEKRGTNPPISMKQKAWTAKAERESRIRAQGSHGGRRLLLIRNLALSSMCATSIFLTTTMHGASHITVERLVTSVLIQLDIQKGCC